MYQIIKEGAVLALTEAPTYIRLHENGSFVLCEERQAQGIAHEGVIYHLLGREALEGRETVLLNETDAGAEIGRSAEPASIAFVSMAESGGIDEVTATEHIGLFEAWAWPKHYTAGQLRTDSGKLWRCIQEHNSQADWNPEAAVSLWTRAGDPTEEWPTWSQPVGAHDAYATGAKVTHNATRWISTADANVWEPGVYGWEAAE